MNQQFRHRQFPAGNPLANALVIIVGIIVISLSLALGFFMFLGIAGFVLVMGAVVGVRNWWLRRRFGASAGRQQARANERPEQPRVIEGEFREVRKRDNDQPAP